MTTIICTCVTIFTSFIFPGVVNEMKVAPGQQCGGRCARTRRSARRSGHRHPDRHDHRHLVRRDDHPDLHDQQHLVVDPSSASPPGERSRNRSAALRERGVLWLAGDALVAPTHR